MFYRCDIQKKNIWWTLSPPDEDLKALGKQGNYHSFKRERVMSSFNVVEETTQVLPFVIWHTKVIYKVEKNNHQDGLILVAVIGLIVPPE